MFDCFDCVCIIGIFVVFCVLFFELVFEVLEVIICGGVIGIEVIFFIFDVLLVIWEFIV